MSDNYDPNNPQPGRIDLGDVNVPDFSRRIPQVPETNTPEDQRTQSEFDDNNGGGSPLEGCMNLFSGNSSTLIFIFVLFIAAFRGDVNGQGCLPGRRCANIIFGALGGIALVFGGLYVGAQTEAAGVATAMACAGSFICLGSLSGVGFLMFSMLRLIDLNPLDDRDGGILDNVLGGILGGGR